MSWQQDITPGSWGSTLSGHITSHHMVIIIHCIIIIPQKFMALDDYGCELWDFWLHQKYQTFFTRHLAWPQLCPASYLSVVDKTSAVALFSSTLKYSANKPSLPLLSLFFFLQSHLEDVMSHMFVSCMQALLLCSPGPAWGQQGEQASSWVPSPAWLAPAWASTWTGTFIFFKWGL